MPKAEKTNYGYSKEVSLSYQDAIDRLTEELMKEGFGVLTTIDVKQKLKEKMGVNMEEYIILGVCNPPLANRALLLEREIGLLLPCNVIVYRHNNTTMISALLPTKALIITGNAKLQSIALQAEEKLIRSIDHLS